MRGVEILESRRLFSAGALNTSFGTAGSVINVLGAQTNFASGQVVADQGKFLAVGYGTASPGGTQQVDLLRYNADGTVDNTFGAGGKVVIETGNDAVKTVIVAPNGSIYVGMLTVLPPPIQYSSHVFRYTPTGQLDTTFATSGELTLDPAVYLQSITTEKDGALLVASYKQTDPGGVVVLGVVPSEIDLQHFNIDGTPDSHFGTNGETDTQLGNEDVPSAMVVQRDGKVIVAGAINNGSIVPDGGPFVARYTSNGVLDTTYGTNGVFTGSTPPRAIALTKSGKLLVTGETVANDIVIERVTTRGRLDKSFVKNGTATFQTNLQLVNADTTMDVDQAGKILIGTEQTLAFVGSETVLTRFNANGSLDKHFGDGGTVSATLTDPGSMTGVAESDHEIVTAEDMNLGTVNTVKELVLVSYKG